MLPLAFPLLFHRCLVKTKHLISLIQVSPSAPLSSLSRNHDFGGSSSSLASSTCSMSSSSSSSRPVQPFSFVERELERVRERSARLAAQAKEASLAKALGEGYQNSLRSYKEDEQQGEYQVRAKTRRKRVSLAYLTLISITLCQFYLPVVAVILRCGVDGL